MGKPQDFDKPEDSHILDSILCSMLIDMVYVLRRLLSKIVYRTQPVFLSLAVPVVPQNLSKVHIVDHLRIKPKRRSSLK